MNVKKILKFVFDFVSVLIVLPIVLACIPPGLLVGLILNGFAILEGKPDNKKEES